MLNTMTYSRVEYQIEEARHQHPIAHSQIEIISHPAIDKRQEGISAEAHNKE
jgi:hypothetical protein